MLLHEIADQSSPRSPHSRPAIEHPRLPTRHSAGMPENSRLGAGRGWPPLQKPSRQQPCGEKAGRPVGVIMGCPKEDRQRPDPPHDGQVDPDDQYGSSAEASTRNADPVRSDSVDCAERYPNVAMSGWTPPTAQARAPTHTNEARNDQHAHQHVAERTRANPRRDHPEREQEHQQPAGIHCRPDGSRTRANFRSPFQHRQQHKR